MIRSKLDLRSDCPYTELILLDLVKYFNQCYEILKVREGFKLYSLEPFDMNRYSSSFIYTKDLLVNDDSFVEVYVCLIPTKALADIIVEGICDANPLILKNFPYVKEKKQQA